MPGCETWPVKKIFDQAWEKWCKDDDVDDDVWPANITFRLGHRSRL